MSTAITAMSALCYCPRTHQHRGLLDTVGLSCYREWETYCLLQFEFSQSTNLITEQSRHLLAHPIYSSLSGRQAIPEQRYDLHSVYALFLYLVHCSRSEVIWSRSSTWQVANPT